MALRVPIGAWPAGTSGTLVTLYDGAASRSPKTIRPARRSTNLLTIPFDELELRWSHLTGWVDGMEASLMEASAAAVTPSDDLQL